MRSFIPFLIFLCWQCAAYCQISSPDQLCISKQGALETLPTGSESGLTICKLEEELNEQKIELLKDIHDRITSTISKIAYSNDSAQYKTLLSSNYVKRLHSFKNGISKALKAKKTDQLIIMDFPHFMKAWNGLSGFKTRIEPSKGNYKIYQPLLASIFYSSYYNEVFNDIRNTNYFRLAQADKDSLDHSFKKLIDSLDHHEDSLTAERYVKLLKSHPYYELFQEPWMEDLIWISRGSPLLFPFTEPIQHSESDSLAEEQYLNYLNSLIDRKIEQDSSGDIEQFQKILAQKKEIEANRIKDKERKEQEKTNQERLKLLQTKEILLNHIQIPEGNDVYQTRNILANVEREEDQEWADLDFLEPKKKIRWFVHNVKENQKISIILKKKVVLQETGAGEQEISDLASLALQVYAMGNPAANLVNSLNTKSNGNAIKGEIPQTELTDLENSSADLNKELADLNKKIANASGEKSLKEQLEKKKKLLEAEIKRLTESLSLLKQTPTHVLLLARNYQKLMAQMTFPIEPWKMEAGEKPLMKTKILNPDISDSLYTYHYHLQSVHNKDTTLIDAVKFKVGKFVRFNLSAGLAYNFGTNKQLSLSQDASGTLSFHQSSEAYSGIVALNYYPFSGGMRKPDNSPTAKGREWSRLFFQAGVGIPKPLDNFFFGGGYNFGPGLMVSGGLYLYGKKEFEVLNNTVVNERKFYKPAGYISLGVDPALFMKVLGIFKSEE